jgi:hypothetical protein
MLSVIGNKKYLKQLSQNAYEWAQTFTWENTSSKLMSVIRKLNREAQLEILSVQNN